MGSHRSGTSTIPRRGLIGTSEAHHCILVKDVRLLSTHTAACRPIAWHRGTVSVPTFSRNTSSSRNSSYPNTMLTNRSVGCRSFQCLPQHLRRLRHVGRPW